MGNVCLILGVGCSSGTVYVSHPQVFTRERLVVAREKEVQFLNSVLDAPVQSTFQGASDIRELSAFQNSLTATISPTAGLASPPTATAATLVADPSKLMPGGAASSMDIAKNVNVTAVDHFNDVIAYREAVNAVIREKELDDTHDREGKTLYTLKFDTALIPGRGISKPAMVKLKISPGGDPKDHEKTYRLWIDQLSVRRQEDENALDARLYRGLVNSSDEALLNYLKYGLEDFIARTKSAVRDPAEQATNIKYVTEAASKTVSIMTLTPEVRRSKLLSVVSDTSERDYLFTGMQLALNAKYCHDFAGLISMDYYFDDFGPKDTLAICRIVPYAPALDPASIWWKQTGLKSKTKSPGVAQFNQVLEEWGQNVYVDSIDPQIYAQNISQVSSHAQLLELALTVNAAVAKPASLSESMKYLHESQRFLQAIKREPLALGFANGSEFGWLLGPPFGVDDKGNVTYEQGATRQSFSVSVVAPAWLRELKIEGRQCWIDSYGKETDEVKLPCVMSIILPRDIDALSSAFQSRATRLRPTLYSSGQYLQAATNGEQTLLIQGRELWRNPAVFVGSTRADTVDLLPDMHGLVAHFKSIPSFYTDKTPADLTVVTSFGADSLEKSITILPASRATNNTPLAKLTNTFAVADGPPLRFMLTGMPSGFAGFSVKTGTKAVPGKWKDLAAADYKLATNNTGVAIAIKITESPPADPTVYLVDLALRENPSDSPHSIVGTNEPSFLYFPAAGMEKPIMQTQQIVFNQNNTPDIKELRVTLAAKVTRKHLYDAFPGLQKAVESSKALCYFGITNAPDKKTKAKLPLKEDGGEWTINLDQATPDGLAAGTYNVFTVEYPQTEDSKASIELGGGPVTIRRP